MNWLTQEDIIDINKLVLRKADSTLFAVQYPQGLDMIVQQPQQVVFGRELYPNIWIKAAFIIQKLTKKHLFTDGNKRTALLAGMTFLALNDYHLTFSAQAGEALILDVTNSPDSEEIMVTLAEWLKRHWDDNR